MAHVPGIRGRFALGGIGICMVFLLWPTSPEAIELPTERTAFRWDADRLFATLEREFTRAGAMDLDDATRALGELETEGEALLNRVSESDVPPHDALGRLWTLQFESAVLGASHPPLLRRVEGFLVRARVALMEAAAVWPADRETHEAVYRVLFGGRIALDEALVQAGTGVLSPLLPIEDIPSPTPSILVEGVRVHSGDVLLSRGGAPTSALIARGNDFPNTFSHTALVHVDGESGQATVIESLIEAGSVTTSVEEYLERKSHRILVLRLRPDHPALSDDSLLPHRAAEAMLARVEDEHIPYDFAMDWEDPTAAFCSEIVYHAYGGEGVDLWTVRSAISSDGLARWLGGLGVREFTSLVPSDVEYDPQLRAVAEWRDAPTLMDYRLDNAVMDALLEEADRGFELSYSWQALPMARLLKLFSMGQSVVGIQPRIPQGMSAATALRVDALVSTVHPMVKEELVRLATDFEERNGYEAPYWVLVQLAREGLAGVRTSLAPALQPPPMAPARRGSADFETLGPFLDSLMLAEGIPGSGFAVFDDSGVLYEHVNGVKDAATGEPVGSETAFEAASISKPVFACIVHSLADEGVLDLDAPLPSLVPEVPELAYDARVGALTPRILLSHQGGLPNWRSRLNFTAPRYSELFPVGDTLRFLTDPAARYQYSGEGYVLLQRIVEDVTGQSLNELARERVFGPLGMTRSSFLFDSDMRGDYALGHNGEGSPDKWEIKLPLASSTLHTTPADLARFGTHLAAQIRTGGPCAGLAAPEVAVDTVGPVGEAWGRGSAF